MDEARNFDAPRGPSRAVCQPASPRPVGAFSKRNPYPLRPVRFVTRPARPVQQNRAGLPRPPVNFGTGPDTQPVNPKIFYYHLIYSEYCISYIQITFIKNPEFKFNHDSSNNFQINAPT